MSVQNRASYFEQFNAIVLPAEQTWFPNLKRLVLNHGCAVKLGTVIAIPEDFAFALGGSREEVNIGWMPDELGEPSQGGVEHQLHNANQHPFCNT